MRTLYFDCKSGISGDMTVGALLDLKLPGIDLHYLNDSLSKLHLHGERIYGRTHEASKHGIAGTKFEVCSEAVPHDDAHHGGGCEGVYANIGDYLKDEYLFDHNHIKDLNSSTMYDSNHRPVIDIDYIRRLYNLKDAHHDLDDESDLLRSDEIAAAEESAAGELIESCTVDLHHDHDFDHMHGGDEHHTHDHDHTHDHGHDHHHGHSHDSAHTHSHEEGEHAHIHVHGEQRGIREIFHIFNNCDLEYKVRASILKTFLILAFAESKVHGVTIDKIHFHEVGAIDSIGDIASVAILLHAIDAKHIIFSDIYEGSGQIMCDHGLMPVPVPATLELLTSNNIPFIQTKVSGELITPTGAVITAYFGNVFGALMPRMSDVKIGIGCGTKDFPQANVLRVALGDSIDEGMMTGDEVAVLETNIDDMTSEALAYVCDLLMREGALDVWQTPIVMKKGRSAVMLSAICAKEKLDATCKRILENTSSIGLRYYYTSRVKMDRRVVDVLTEYGPAKIKVSSLKNIEKSAPEYDTVAALAAKHKVPFERVYKAVLNAYAKLRK